MTAQDFERLYGDCHTMGGMSSYAYEDDPKHLVFTLARYKHVAKLLSGYGEVLEVGCADGFGSRIVAQHVTHLTAIDVDRQSIAEAIRNQSQRWPIAFAQSDFLIEGAGWKFDAAYSLDVFEHMPDEGRPFLKKLADMAPVVIIGTPSLESQVHASRLSKEGHVNCVSGPILRERCLEHFDHVFMFSMNDEALGTGFLPMAHYLVALCVRG